MNKLPATLQLPNRMVYLPVALSFVREMSHLVELSQAQRQDLEVACDEAISNVIRHAYPDSEEAHFEVRCEFLPRGLQVAICDRGIPLDPQNAPEGMGSMLMRAMVSQVCYVNLGARGKEVRLLTTTNEQRVSEPEHPPEHPHDRQSPGELITRPMQPQEAVQVSRCFFEAYGYSYVYEDVYYPERMAALQATSQIYSAVAVSARQEVVSHMALRFSHLLPGVAEVAMAATRPRYQGNKVISSLESVLMAECLRRNLSGVFSNAVTVHPYSQRGLLKNGFRICGFLLAHSLETTKFTDLSDSRKERGSVAICYLQLSKPRSFKAFPPASCRELVQRIYEHLQLPMELADEAAVVRDSSAFRLKSEVHLTLHSERAVASLDLQRYGQDIDERLREALFHCKRHHMKVVEALLNLADPYTPVLAELLEREGFRLTGIVPGVTGGDRMVMQYFNGIAADYQSVKIEDPFAKELLAAIQASDPLGGFA